MSTLLGKKPLSVVIFDRTSAGLSDVPVFAEKLKQKVNTPIAQEITSESLSPQALGILDAIKRPNSDVREKSFTQEASVLCADSSGGQTGEFAQSTEETVSVDSVHSSEAPSQLEILESAILSLADDPALIRIPTIIPEYIPPVIIPRSLLLLGPQHVKGLENVVVIPAYKQNLLTDYEEIWYAGKRWSRSVVAKIVQLPFFLNLLVGDANDLRIKASKWLREKKAIVFGRIQSRPRLSLKLSLPTLPTIHVPTIDVRVPKLPEFNFARFTSRVLIAGSLVLMLLTVGPMVALEMQSIKQKISYAITNLPTHAQESSGEIEGTKPTPIPSSNPDPDKQFQIIIPRIGVNSKVIANVDASNEKEYTEALKKGVAHAAGTGLPGEPNTENKTIFIFGHSTNGTWNIARYNALFYALKDMLVGDDLSIWFWGKEFHYTVKETKIVAADDVSFLKPQTDKDQLILQTCWPPGTSWKRLLVIAEPKK